MYKVDNAVIMAAGVSSRFAPLSYEKPKALTEVCGEILIERQISQLHEAGIFDIYVVIGYMAEQFQYLSEKFGVHLIENPEYLTRNNHSSIYAAKDIIRNTYICSADNYFTKNPFESEVSESYYAAVYAQGNTREWCMETDDRGYIRHVEVGGRDAWYMLGHAFWSEEFSKSLLQLLDASYNDLGISNLFWEDIFIRHLDTLKMQMRKYPDGFIFEFDSIDELRQFDKSYISDTRSAILKQIAQELHCSEADITDITPCKSTNTTVIGICFAVQSVHYVYHYTEQVIRRYPDGI